MIILCNSPICEELLYICILKYAVEFILITYKISQYKIAFIVKILKLLKSNLQIMKNMWIFGWGVLNWEWNNLVRISETTRGISNSSSNINLRSKVPARTRCGAEDLYEVDLKFNEWLAGLIDGDGHFGISQGKYTSCEITVELKDAACLYYIKNKLGGSVKLRSGSNSIRYRLHNKIGMINLVNRVNGNIRNSVRKEQLKKICEILEIKLKKPKKLTKDNSWFSGFFDGDGTIGIYLKNEYPQLIISVTNKYKIDVEDFKKVFGGNIHYDKSQNGYYKWEISSKEDILNYVSYIKSNRSRTSKFSRLMLCNKYYELKDLKCYKSEFKVYKKAWDLFMKKWNS